MDNEMVLCVSNAYEKKFYLNPEFDSLPESIRQELQIMCVLYTEDVGGILMLVFDEKGNLELKVDHEENDFFFDEIGSVLKIKELQNFIAGQETDITEFDEALVKKLIEKITVFADHFTVEFKSGITIDIGA